MSSCALGECSPDPSSMASPSSAVLELYSSSYSAENFQKSADVIDSSEDAGTSAFVPITSSTESVFSPASAEPDPDPTYPTKCDMWFGTFMHLVFRSLEYFGLLVRNFPLVWVEWLNKILSLL